MRKNKVRGKPCKEALIIYELNWDTNLSCSFFVE